MNDLLDNASARRCSRHSFRIFLQFLLFFFLFFEHGFSVESHCHRLVAPGIKAAQLSPHSEKTYTSQLFWHVVCMYPGFFSHSPIEDQYAHMLLSSVHAAASQPLKRADKSTESTTSIFNVAWLLWSPETKKSCYDTTIKP